MIWVFGSGPKHPLMKRRKDHTVVLLKNLLALNEIARDRRRPHVYLCAILFTTKDV